jgi:Protein of unknown function (DUF3592)
MQDLQPIIIIFASVFGGLILLMTMVKLFQIWRARNWPAVPGRVVRSEVESKMSAAGGRGRGATAGNYALVAYDYVVNGRSYKARRVDLGEPAPNSEVEETLARYPVGTAVSVYYNPAKPEEAFLEHLPLRRFAYGLGIFFVLIGGGALGAIFGFKHFFAWGERYLPHAQNPQFVVLIAAMGVFALLFALASLKQTAKEKLWPVVQGKILDSRVESYRSSDVGSRSNTHCTLYRPAIAYLYEVRGRTYEGSRITDGPTGGSSVRGPAEKVVRRYSIGRVVDVRYNPENVAESILEVTVSGFIFALIIATVLFALAVVTSGYFNHPK